MDTDNLNDTTIRQAVELYFSDDQNEKIKDIGNWNVLEVTDMGGLFSERKLFNASLEKWDTSNVNDMSLMFLGCSSFNQTVRFKTSKVTNMSYMFKDCSAFNGRVQFNDTSNVKNMSNMFSYCYAFNREVDFDTSNVKNMSNMFSYCYAFNRDVDFDTSNVVDMSNMFRGCIAFNRDLSWWNTSSLENWDGMFQGCTTLLKKFKPRFHQYEHLIFLPKSPISKSSKLTIKRRMSFTKSDQGDADTCWAHAIAKLISKYLRVLYDTSFSEEHANCDILFNTEKCLEIFSCIESCKNQTIINYAILFNLIYKILISMYGDVGLPSNNIINAILTTLKVVHGNQENLIDILQIPDSKVSEKIHNGIVYTFSIIRGFSESSVLPSFFLCRRGEVVDIIKLKQILSYGFYIYFVARQGEDDHAMIISGYDRESDKYQIKNSWGENMSYYLEPSSMFYDSKNELLIPYLFFIVPEIPLELPSEIPVEVSAPPAKRTNFQKISSWFTRKRGGRTKLKTRKLLFARPFT